MIRLRKVCALRRTDPPRRGEADAAQSGFGQQKAPVAARRGFRDLGAIRAFRGQPSEAGAAGLRAGACCCLVPEDSGSS